MSAAPKSWECMKRAESSSAPVHVRLAAATARLGSAGAAASAAYASRQKTFLSSTAPSRASAYAIGTPVSISRWTMSSEAIASSFMLRTVFATQLPLRRACAERARRETEDSDGIRAHTGMELAVRAIVPDRVVLRDQAGIPAWSAGSFSAAS